MALIFVVRIIAPICLVIFYIFFQAEDGIRDDLETGVQTCAHPIISYAVFCLKKKKIDHLGRNPEHGGNVVCSTWRDSHIQMRRYEGGYLGAQVSIGCS